MEAKEKAKELFDKYHDIFWDTDVNWELSRQWALIAVNQILDMDCVDMCEEEFNKHIDYWNDVKNEINKL